MDELGVRWYVAPNADVALVPDGANRVTFITVPQDSSVWTAIEDDEAPLTDAELANLGFKSRNEIRQMAADSPGSYWYIWGEVNRYDYMTGTRFAPVFRYFSVNLKIGDPTAKIIGPSLLNWDFTCYGCECSTCFGGFPSGQSWLQEFITAYENLEGSRG